MSTVPTITRDELKAKLDRGESIILAEVLPEQHYREAHLPGAIHLPLEDLEQVAATKLSDKSAEIIVYCANTACQNSPKAALKLRQLGYSHVKDFEAGKQDWVEAGFPTESSATARA